MYFLGVGKQHGCTGTFLMEEGGIPVLAGIVPCYETCRILIGNPPWPATGLINLAKKEFREFTSM